MCYLISIKSILCSRKGAVAQEGYQYLKTSMKEHVLSDELLAAACTAIARGNVYVAYNDIPYFLDTGDVSFFKTPDEAHEFSMNNISEYDNYNVVVTHSIDELLRVIPYGEAARIQLITNKNNLPMNENNLKYLQDNIKYHGFGETLNPLLEEQIKKGVIEFTLPYKVDVNKREMEATLHFKKSDTTDMYFFNKYDAKVKNEKNEDMAQTFYINKGTGVTLKEAYNLLNGRAVYKELTNKEDQKYKAWIQLDFSAKDKHGNYERKPYHDNYGYDLKEALSYFPIKEMMKEDSMKDLLRSLEKGNAQMVTLAMPDKDLKVFIEASPKYKNINVYDNRMKPLVHEHKEELMKKPELKEEKDQKQTLGQEDKTGKKQGAKRKAGEDGENNGLVKKKNNNNSSKGMGVH